MVVNSFYFLFFFSISAIIYYLPVAKSTPRFQNLWLLLCSYFFYGFADWRMLPLLIAATGTFYGLGLWLHHEMGRHATKQSSLITTIGVILGVGILLYFKYLNFFASSFAVLLNSIGLHVSWTTLNIILPVGVSFFTFKLISYVIEIHREHIEPSRDPVEFACYVAFFPTILSGPIDRPSTFLPQLQHRHCFDYSLALDGGRQILWGMFTKMCIADNLATLTDNVWQSYNLVSTPTLLVVALVYPIQMYADFDGYSNMAIGVGKLLGFRITRNFNHPLLARNTAEYWRRWHMSLTSWITDYIFMPLNIAFRNKGNWGIMMACIINLIVIGFWHGANWTYGFFGLYHGLLFVPLILSGTFGKNRKLRPNNYGLPQGSDLMKMFITYVLISIGLVIFRAPTITDALSFLSQLFTASSPSITSVNTYVRPITFLFIIILILAEWVKRSDEHPLQFSHHFLLRYRIIRWALYYTILFAIILFQGQSNTFIYFQF